MKLVVLFMEKLNTPRRHLSSKTSENFSHVKNIIFLDGYYRPLNVEGRILNGFGFGFRLPVSGFGDQVNLKCILKACVCTTFFVDALTHSTNNVCFYVVHQRIYKKIAHTQAFRTHFRLTWSLKPATGTRNPNPKPETKTTLIFTHLNVRWMKSRLLWM